MTTRRRFLSGLVASGSVVLGYSSIGKMDNTVTDRDVEVIGHRGSSAKYEDNSIRGVRFAGQNKSDGVELDIRKTADDVFVLNHHPFRLNGFGSYDISNKKYNELRKSTGSVIKLTEAIDVIKQYDMKLVAGMKEPHNAEGIWDTIVEKDYADRSRMVMWARHVSDYLIDAEKTIIVSTFPNTYLIQQAKDYNIETVMCHYINGGTNSFIRKANENGLEAGYWCLSESTEDLRRGLSKDPDIIMTNRPKEAIQMLDK